jgi:hypothetical protein
MDERRRGSTGSSKGRPVLSRGPILAVGAIGAAMGVATAAGLVTAEAVAWLVLLPASAAALALKTRERRFAYGWWAGLIMGALTLLIQSLLFDLYAAHYPEVVKQIEHGGVAWSPRVFFAALALPAGLVTGLVLGVLTCGAGWLLDRRVRGAAPGQMPNGEAPGVPAEPSPASG